MLIDACAGSAGMIRCRDRRRFRILNIVDDVTKECLGAIPDTSISGRRVARELTAIIERHGRPGMIVSDRGTEYTCNAMLASQEHQQASCDDEGEAGELTRLRSAA
jgi:transposase InsO family protein